MAEKQCPKCKMMIDKDATKCPHCRSTVGTSKSTWVVLCGIIFIVFLLWVGSSSQTDDKVILKDFFYHCMDTMPKNEGPLFCTQSALGRKFKFDDVEAILKQYVAEHPEQTKKKKTKPL